MKLDYSFKFALQTFEHKQKIGFIGDKIISVSRLILDYYSIDLVVYDHSNWWRKVGLKHVQHARKIVEMDDYFQLFMNILLMTLTTHIESKAWK